MSASIVLKQADKLISNLQQTVAEVTSLDNNTPGTPYAKTATLAEEMLALSRASGANQVFHRDLKQQAASALPNAASALLKVEVARNLLSASAADLNDPDFRSSYRLIRDSGGRNWRRELRPDEKVNITRMLSYHERLDDLLLAAAVETHNACPDTPENQPQRRSQFVNDCATYAAQLSTEARRRDSAGMKGFAARSIQFFKERVRAIELREQIYNENTAQHAQNHAVWTDAYNAACAHEHLPYLSQFGDNWAPRPRLPKRKSCVARAMSDFHEGAEGCEDLSCPFRTRLEWMADLHAWGFFHGEEDCWYFGPGEGCPGHHP